MTNGWLVALHRQRLAGSEFSVLCGTYIACNLWLHCATADNVSLYGQDVELVYKTICETLPVLRDMTNDSVLALAEAAKAELAKLGIRPSENIFACECDESEKPTVH